MNTTQKISFIDSHFFIWIDAHLRNWKVTIRFNGLELKAFSMNPSPLELIAYLKNTIQTASIISSMKLASVASEHCVSFAGKQCAPTKEPQMAGKFQPAQLHDLKAATTITRFLFFYLNRYLHK